MSDFVSPFVSATATDVAISPADGYVTGNWKVPSPLPGNTPSDPVLDQALFIRDEHSLATAISN